MFRFVHPEYLYWLFLIPGLLGLFLYSQWKSRHLESKLGNRFILKRLIPLRSTVRPVVKFCLQLVAVILFILLLARPQFGSNLGKIKRKGIEVIFVLDVSQSMLAQDVHPSRIERSKLLISTLTERMKNDKIGLAIFAGEAYPMIPITNDKVSIQFFLDNISTEMVSLQGTNIASAIRLAEHSFTKESSVGKAIVIITDGEDHEAGAIEAARAATKKGKKVYMLGVGSTTGARIPTENGFLTDNAGNIVKTALNESMCKEIAQAGNGEYIHIDGSNFAQEQLESALRQLQQNDSEIIDEGTMNEEFQNVALLLFVILLIELFTSEKKNPFWSRFRLFSK